MTSALAGTPLPVGSAAPGTLRSLIEERRARGGPLPLGEAVHLLVPVCVDLAARHGRAEKLFVHPSSVVASDGGSFAIDPARAAEAPTLPRDKTCLAPEERGAGPGDARASVYAVGAMLYEMLTGQCVGPGMRRPTEIVPTLPPELEGVLGMALIADAAQRPEDLSALAQAIHGLAPSGTVPPPRATELSSFEVDISMSMLPPAPPPSLGGTPYDVLVQDRTSPVKVDATNELAQLKARLESDPRPRYVVVKEGMDHGPFSAVELLQQIASNAFVEGDVLRDAFSKDERAIRDWDEFAPFAEQARLGRDIKAEKAAIEKVVVEERKSTRGKALVGVAIVGALVAAAAAWMLVRRGERDDSIAVQGDTVTNVETDGGLKVPAGGQRRAGGGGRGVVGNQGGIPILAGGMSCEGAQAAYVEEMNIGGAKGPADLTAGQYGAILNKGTYFAHCGAPDDMKINICAAVQNGRAVGVTVTTDPRNPGVAGCIAGGVRGLSFPSHPKLDVTRTSF
ncbi:MAG: hypothetical protein IT376_23000 [Polyangiaceae bacterium]|nr:hypothetical protein [Polyangiaceae bacterium]